MSDDIKEFTPKTAEEVTAEIIKEYGLDAGEEANKPFIEKLTSERLENQTKLSTAITQKISHRKEKETYEKFLVDAKLDPKTGKPLEEKKPDEVKPEFVTKEEFARANLRQTYSYMTDDEFGFVEATAKGMGKSFKDVLETPIVKSHFETIDAQNRIAGATGAPSTRFKSSESTEEQKIAKEFDRDLPVGFSSKKN
jgi:hypothetical protein